MKRSIPVKEKIEAERRPFHLINPYIGKIQRRGMSPGGPLVRNAAPKKNHIEIKYRLL
jgi:hypothetical protein